MRVATFYDLPDCFNQAGLQLTQLAMEEELKLLVGKRSHSLPERTANRRGSERGYCVVLVPYLPQAL